MDNPIAEAYIKMLQERNKKEDKMDPVGQGDADIDNDGDVDSSDEYLHKRRKAIKKSMKKEEFTEEEQAMIDEAKKRGLTPDQVRKALASDKAKSKGKSSVSLRKTPWDKFKEAVEIETDDDKKSLFNNSTNCVWISTTFNSVQHHMRYCNLSCSALVTCFKVDIFSKTTPFCR